MAKTFTGWVSLPSHLKGIENGVYGRVWAFEQTLRMLHMPVHSRVSRPSCSRQRHCLRPLLLSSKYFKGFRNHDVLVRHEGPRGGVPRFKITSDFLQSLQQHKLHQCRCIRWLPAHGAALIVHVPAFDTNARSFGLGPRLVALQAPLNILEWIFSAPCLFCNMYSRCDTVRNCIGSGYGGPVL